MVFSRRYSSAGEAERLMRSVVADDPSFVTAARAGSRLTFSVVAASAASARATIDDLLACLAAAERTLSLGSERR